MARAQSRSSGSPAPPKATSKSTVRRRIRPVTISIIAVTAVVALGVMFVVFSGAWPLSPGYEREPKATVVAIRDAGLIVEKGGEPRWEGAQVYVPVKVTNNYVVSVAASGTPTPGAPVPTPGEADVAYAGIKVYFYGEHVGNTPPPILGVAWGEVLNLPYGESRVVEAIGIDIPRNYNSWEPEIDTVQPRTDTP